MRRGEDEKDLLRKEKAKLKRMKEKNEERADDEVEHDDEKEQEEKVHKARRLALFGLVFVLFSHFFFFSFHFLFLQMDPCHLQQSDLGHEGCFPLPRRIVPVCRFDRSRGGPP